MRDLKGGTDDEAGEGVVEQVYGGWVVKPGKKVVGKEVATVSPFPIPVGPLVPAANYCLTLHDTIPSSFISQQHRQHLEKRLLSYFLLLDALQHQFYHLLHGTRLLQLRLPCPLGSKIIHPPSSRGRRFMRLPCLKKSERERTKTIRATRHPTAIRIRWQGSLMRASTRRRRITAKSGCLKLARFVAQRSVLLMRMSKRVRLSLPRPSLCPRDIVSPSVRQYLVPRFPK